MVKIKDVIRILISMALMFFILGFALSLFTRTSLLSDKYINKTIAKSTYYSQLNTAMEFSLENFAMINSLPESMVNQIINEEEIKYYSEESVKNTVAYLKYETDAPGLTFEKLEIEKKLDAYLMDYTSRYDLEYDEDLRLQAKEISEELSGLLKINLTLINVENASGYSQFQQFRRIISTIYDSIGLWTLAVVSAIAFLAIHCRRRMHRTFIWVGSSFTAASLFMLIPSLMALLLKIPSKISISSQHINEAVRNLSQGYVWFFFITGTISLIIGIASLTSYTLLSRRKVNSRNAAEFSERLTE